MVGGPKVSTRIAIYGPAWFCFADYRKFEEGSSADTIFFLISRDLHVYKLNSAILPKASEQRRGCPRLVADHQEAGR